MKKFNLQSIIRKKNSSYKGQTRRIADNHVKRDFEATAPNQKWFTDVTEFKRRKVIFISNIRCLWKILRRIERNDRRLHILLQ